MHHNNKIILESVLDDVEASRETSVSRIKEEILPERPYPHDYDFQKECYKMGCDCLVCIILDMSEYTDDEIVEKCADVREKFSLVVERRSNNHSQVYAGVKQGEYKNKSTDIILKSGLGIGCCIENGGIQVRGNYSVAFCVGVKIDTARIDRFIDLLANTYGLMKAVRRQLDVNTGLQTGFVDVLMLRSVKYEYTRQYLRFTSLSGDNFPYATQRLYDLKYFGTSFRDWYSFYELILKLLREQHPEIKEQDIVEAIDVWMKKYSKKNRPNKYTRVHT